MAGMRMLPSFLRPNRGLQASGTGTKPVDPHPVKLPSKQETPPSRPGLQRVNSLPTHLPSNPLPQRPEAKPIQGMMYTSGDGKNSPMVFSEESFRPGKLSRPLPDTEPPVTYMRPPGNEPLESSFEKRPRKIFNIPIPFTQQMSKRTWDACAEKWSAMPTGDSIIFEHPEYMLKNKEYMDILKEKHPDFKNYSPEDKDYYGHEVLKKHPKYQAELAKSRNELYSIPSGPTGERMMKPGEQRFLTAALKRIGEEFKHKPLRIHGETAITGTKKGRISEPVYYPTGGATFFPKNDDNYNLHTHPPYQGPLTNSASEADHKTAAEVYLRVNKMGTYFSNGKDVMHISPTSTELTKLIADPKLEKKLGKFPVGYIIPDPQRPPNPFTNHEAPGEFR